MVELLLLFKGTEMVLFVKGGGCKGAFLWAKCFQIETFVGFLV